MSPPLPSVATALDSRYQVCSRSGAESSRRSTCAGRSALAVGRSRSSDQPAYEIADVTALHFGVGKPTEGNSATSPSMVGANMSSAILLTWWLATRGVIPAIGQANCQGWSFAAPRRSRRCSKFRDDQGGDGCAVRVPAAVSALGHGGEPSAGRRRWSAMPRKSNLDGYRRDPAMSTAHFRLSMWWVPISSRPVRLSPAEVVSSFAHEMAKNPQASEMLQRLRQDHEPDRHGWCGHPTHAYRWERHPCDASAGGLGRG